MSCFAYPVNANPQISSTEFLVCRHTHTHTFRGSPFDVRAFAFVHPPSLSTPSSFLLSHFSPSHPRFHLANIKRAEHTRVFSNFVSVFNPAPLILPPLSLVPRRLFSSLSLHFSPISNIYIYIHLRFFFSAPFFLVRFWLRGSPPLSLSMYFVKPSVVPITSARVQPGPDLVASSMKLIRLVRCRHTSCMSCRQLKR